ncbi:MAG: hypothetical protein PHZ07_01235 [Patescibacteria group bacterium]|nr:hypothetical protein [Patescibacteria group bacterium]MDD4303940.1 hypothetical protein [Patescibacteria group bacterium]MDD4695072.1 hypothetical protein [Patescibacteria group bacterium]
MSDEVQTKISAMNYQLGIIIIILILMFLGQCSSKSEPKSPWVFVDGKTAYLQTFEESSMPEAYSGNVIFIKDSIVCQSHVTKRGSYYKSKKLEKTLPLNEEQAQLWANRIEQRMFETGKY